MSGEDKQEVTLEMLHKTWLTFESHIDMVFAYINGTPEFGRDLQNGKEAIRRAFDVARRKEAEDVKALAGESPEEASMLDEATRQLEKKTGRKLKRVIPGPGNGVAEPPKTGGKAGTKKTAKKKTAKKKTAKKPRKTKKGKGKKK